MKIAIIEDSENSMRSLVRTLSERHEILQVLVRDHDPKQIAEEVKRFGPDLVLVDHDLKPFNDFNGGTVAGELDLPRTQLLGISTTFEQEYCARVFQSKDRLFPRADERDDPRRVEMATRNRDRLLRVIEEPVS